MHSWFSLRPIRQKLILAYALSFFVLIIAGGLFTDAMMRVKLEEGMEDTLRNSTQTILNLLESSLNSSIRSYLHGVAAQDLKMVEDLAARVERGEITESEAKSRARALLGAQRIGKTGYTCVLDSGGTMRVHPKPALVDANLSQYEFVREITAKKDGYLEYEWQNPDDRDPRPKAMYMAYFKPWDWIILASAYRNEFGDLLNMEDLRRTVLSMKAGKSGYSFIVNMKGDILVHPFYEGKNIHGMEGQSTEFFDEMKLRPGGRQVYYWRNQSDETPVKKMLIYNQLPQFGWIVASTTSLEEIYEPLNGARYLFLVFLAAALTVLLTVTYYLSRTITSPIKELAERLKEQGAELLPLPEGRQRGDEAVELARIFDLYLERLNSEIEERRWLERKVIESGDAERARIGQELHDDLAPHLAGIEVLCKVLHEKLSTGKPLETSSVEIMRKLIAEATFKVRQMARGLCPLHLSDNQFELMLREIASQVAAIHGINCMVTSENIMPGLDSTTATQLIFIVREAIHNAVKHANASRVEIAAEEVGRRLTVTVSDDGKGFDKSAAGSGMGLSIMRYRATMIGARLSICGRAEGGTVVEVVTRELGDDETL